VWVLLAVIGGASRLPFARATPINWDAVQFALAVDKFDLHAHQPHPPGYILYALAGRALNLPVGEPGAALGLLSVLASAAALPVFFALARRMFDDSAIAWGATALLAASPLALYYGSVGLTYIPEMLLSLLVAALCWRLKTSADHSLKVIALLALALAVAGGVRQTSLPVLLPLCVWALWGSSRRSWLVFGLTLVGACLLWLVPLLVLSGGLASYLRESALLADLVMSRTSVFDAGLGGLAYNATFITLALVAGLGLGIVPLGLWALGLVRFGLVVRVRAFLALWIFPTLLFYAVSHVGQYGYLLVVLPPLVTLSAVAARVLATLLAGRHPRIARHAGVERLGFAVCGAAALFGLAYFAFAQGPVTASAIERNDSYWHALRSELSSYNPDSTVLVTSLVWGGPFRQAGYLLPQYRTFGIDFNQEDTLKWLYSAENGVSDYALPMPAGRDRVDLPPNTRTLLVLDSLTESRFAPEGVLYCVSLPDGSTLYAIQVPDSYHRPQAIYSLLIAGDKIAPVGTLLPPLP
jgi:hypothetical protein